MSEQRILIIGGGFVGTKCALELAKKKLPNVQIRLVSDKSNFEYHGALYRLVTGRSPLEVCLPLRDILGNYDVDLVQDRIENLDTQTQTATGVSGSTYSYDTLVLGLGSETNYYGIPGLKELSLGMKTIDDALRLKTHINETINKCLIDTEGHQLSASSYVIIGGGATGVEMASELSIYARELAMQKGVDPSYITVDLIEGASRLLPALPEHFATRVEKKLRSLGVNVYLNRRILEQELDEVTVSGMELKTQTVIWTAGVRAHSLYADIPEIETDTIGRIKTDEYLRPAGHSNIYVGGDGAATQYSGMAQTGLQHGSYIADTIARKLRQQPAKSFPGDKTPIYAIPIGPGWSATQFGALTLYGKPGWWVRRLVDFVVFINFLPLFKAISAFRASQPLCAIDIDPKSL